MIIGVDLDGCTANYYEGLRNYVGGKLGIPAEQIADVYPDPQHYDMREWPDFEANFVKYHTDAVKDGLFANLDVMPGASETLWKLNEEGHNLRVITSRFVSHGSNGLVISDTGHWLDKNDIPYRDIMFVRDKTSIYADVYIDDSPDNIAALQAKGSEVIIFNAKYNESLEGRRAYNWEDVIRHVTEIEKLSKKR